MEGRELRRSYTQMDFPRGYRGFVPPQQFMTPQQVRQRRPQHNQMAPTRVRFPSLEIYRPPGQRNEGSSCQTDATNSKLNVYAKEFTMNSPLQTSKSTGNVHGVLHQFNNLTLNQNSPLQHTASATHMKSVLSHNQGKFIGQPKVQPQVRFQDAEVNNNKSRGFNQLKRSKSLTTAHQLKTEPQSSLTPSDFGPMPKHMVELITQAHAAPESLNTSQLMDVAKSLIERASEGPQYPDKIARTCYEILDKELKSTTFSETLFNYCQFVVERIKSGKSTNPRLSPFMAFLCELYSQVKRKPIEYKSHARNLLMLIVQTCLCSLKEPFVNAKPEMERLFYTVTTIGRDLDKEPKLSQPLVAAMRDVFLSNDSSNFTKKTLLQLIELQAAKWQLSAKQLQYYSFKS